MQLPSSLLENAVNEFSKLPGIGKKTALRLVLHLLKQDIGEVLQFGDTITKMRQEIKFCQRCLNISDADTCSICAQQVTKPANDMRGRKHSRCNSN
jgi:recombination protein RecR